MGWTDKLNCQTVLSLILDPSCSSIVTAVTKAFFVTFKFTTFTFAAIVAMSFNSLIKKDQLMA
jgi:hypothetical protein